MKTWLKRSLGITLMAVIMASSLVGCSNNKTPSVDNTNNNSGPQSEVAKVHKLKMLGQESLNQFIKFQDRDQYPVWTELQKMLDEKNLDLEYELVPAEQYKVVIQTRMASGTNLPDIANISPLDNTSALVLAKQGIILDISEPIKQYSDGTIRQTIEKYYSGSDGNTIAPDGKKYWFTNLHYKHYDKNKDAPVGLTINIRKDWLDALKIDTPTNADEFFNAMKAFRDNDVNKSGTADEVFVASPKNFANGIAQWFGLGYNLTSIDATTLKVSTPWYQDGIKDYFEYMQKLVKAGILDTTGLANVDETLNQKRAENKLAACFAYGTAMWNENMTPDKNSVYLPLMPLNAKEGITPYAVMEPNTLVWHKYAITKGCKDIEGAIKFFDVVHTDRYIELTTWGIKDQYYEVNTNGDNVYKDRVSDEEAAKRKNVRGNPLWGKTVFPVMQIANLEFELASIPDYKHEYQLKVMNYKPWYASMNDTYLAMPTDEQIEEKNKYASGVQTYSEELATKIILGQAPLSDWDKYMKQFKELGLDKLIEIDQALVDRYQELTK